MSHILSNGVKILLVEPDEYYQHNFREAMNEVGEVMIEGRGSGIKKLLQDSRPDIMIMELLLPDMSGFALLKELRNEGLNHRTPIVIYSQIDNLEDIEEALNFGVMGYFLKGQDTVHDIKQLILTILSNK